MYLMSAMDHMMASLRTNPNQYPMHSICIADAINPNYHHPTLTNVMQVVYLRLADMVKNKMSTNVPLAERILMQTASMETNRLMCLAASHAAGHHIEEIMQARPVRRVPS